MRRRLSTAQLAEFLLSVPADLNRQILVLRQLILRTLPSVDEAIKFNSLCYFMRELPYGAIGGNVCMITPKCDCVHLGFIHGADLPDPAGLLEGSAKAKRFVTIRASNDIPNKPLRMLLKAALANLPSL